VLFSLAASPDGRLLAVAGGDEMGREGNKAGELKVWDLARGKEIREFRDGPDTVTSVAFSPDGKLLVSGNIDRKVRLWDAATGQLVLQMQGHEKLVRAVAFSPDGRLLATGGFDGKVQLWDVPTGKLLATLKAKPVLSLAFSPDGRMLAAGTGDGDGVGEVKVWERKQGQGGAPARDVIRAGQGATAPKDVIAGSVDELKLLREKKSGLAEGMDRLDQLVQELVKGKRSDEQATEALCLATLSRLPTEAEKKFVTDYLAKQKDRQEALANVLWVFTNSKEFGVNVEALRKREKR
jgi:hypothetical protein